MFHHPPWMRASTVALAVVPLALAGLASSNAQAAPSSAVTARSAYPGASSIAWGACDPVQTGLECATTKVPLDYDRPYGEQIDLALIRVPATDQANRIGSLFVNPGGPGGPGVPFVQFSGQRISEAVNGRFDVVGFDPRGIGASTPLVCFESFDDVIAALPPFSFPTNATEEAQQQTANRKFADACTSRGGPIINHMSTADTARDLDRLRAAVGDEQLSYLGYSYGTHLGTVYANLFPGRVRALALDGVLDPVAWTTGTAATRNQPFSTRLRSGQGARETQDQFFIKCDQAALDADPATACSVGPNSKQRFGALAEKLKSTPGSLPDGSVVLYSDFIGFFLSGLYRVSLWPETADFLVAVESGSPATLAKARTALAKGLGQGAAAPPFGQTLEGFPGVACTDSRNPQEFAAWSSSAAQAEAQDGPFGRLWTWRSALCQPWSGSSNDRYLGPWSARTANPVLVVGNYYDPATRYQGAQALNRLLPRSRLLSYAGWGHTAFLAAGSTCVDQSVAAYLLTKTLPAPGTVCQPQVVPFSTTAAARAKAGGEIPVVGLPPAARRALSGR